MTGGKVACGCLRWVQENVSIYSRPPSLKGFWGVEGKGIRIMCILKADNEVEVAITWGRFIRPSDEGLRMTEGVWDCFEIHPPSPLPLSREGETI